MTFDPARFKTKKDLHLARKLWHVGAGVLYGLGYQWFFSLGQLMALCALTLAVYLPFEGLRIYRPELHKRVLRPWYLVLRPTDFHSVNTGVYFLIAVIVVALIFPKPIAVAAILCLGFGDPIASLVGLLFGKRRIAFLGNKSALGIFANLVVCGLICWIFVGVRLPIFRGIAVSAIGGVAGAISEAAPTGLDDNLVIPPACATALWLACMTIDAMPTLEG